MNSRAVGIIIISLIITVLLVVALIIGLSYYFGNTSPQTYSTHTITVIDKYDYNFIIVANTDNKTQVYKATTLTDYLKFIRGNSYTVVISESLYGWGDITNGTIRQILNSKDKTIIGNYTVIPQGNTT